MGENCQQKPCDRKRELGGQFQSDPSSDEYRFIRIRDTRGVRLEQTPKEMVFLPRKASNHSYHIDDDEMKGTNALVVASEDFNNIEVCSLY